MSDTAPRASFTSFQGSTAEDWQIIVSQLPETQRMVADNVLHLLRVLDNDFGGFPVSRLEHSLQTATRAERDGRDAEYVVCALVHDIGDTLSPGLNHPAIGAELVKPVVSEGHHFMVLNHGLFQGYHYFHHLGLDRDLRDMHKDSPYYDLTDEFTAKYDSLAFDPDYTSEPLEHFEPMVRELFDPKV